MINSPQAWQRLHNKVDAATAGMTDAQLTDRVAQLQRRWQQTRRGTTFDLLHALYRVQHSRRCADPAR